ncbi:MAG: STAS domain-containing protein [Prolixibacteraceae bacterium]
MNVITETIGEAVLISVTGSIDSRTAGDLQTQIMGRVSETSHAVLDLSAVSFVSSAGLRVLLMVYRQIKAKDGKVILVGISEEIRDVMAMTGFINFFMISDTIDDALKLF